MQKVGGRGGCKQRIKVIVKMQKKKKSRAGVRADVNDKMMLS